MKIQLRTAAVISATLWSVILGLGPAAAPPCQAQDDLTWKFNRGDVFYLQETVQQEQSVEVTIAGDEDPDTRSDVKKTSQTTVTRFNVAEVGENGEVDLEMTIASVKDDGDRTTDIGQRIAGAQFTLSVGNTGEVARFGGYDAFIKRVANGNVQFGKLFQAILSEDTLKKTLSQVLTAVPRDPVSAGQTWTQQQSLSIGPFGQMDILRTYKHAGLIERDGVKFARFEITGKAEYRPPSHEETGFPFKVTKGELSIEEMQGTGLFNLQTGRIEQLDMSMKVKGTLTMKVGRQVAIFDIDQTQTSKVRVSNEPPQG